MPSHEICAATKLSYTGPGSFRRQGTFKTTFLIILAEPRRKTLPFHNYSKILTAKMRFASIASSLAAMLALGSALPAKNGPSKSQIQEDLKALADVEGTDVDPNLENGTILVDNGQGRCVASSGKAVCSGISG